MPRPRASVSTTSCSTFSSSSPTSRARLCARGSLSPAKYENRAEAAEKATANGMIATPAVELPPRMSPNTKATATTRRVNTAMRRAVRQRFWACASYSDTRGTKVWPPGCVIALAELHLRALAVGLLGQLEVLLRPEPERAGQDVRRKGLQRGVVIAHVAVVEAARESDLVFRRGEVLRQVLELLDRLELRIVL